MADIVESLRRWGSLKTGEIIPEEMGGPNEWGVPLAKILNEAADEIERLRKETRAVWDKAKWDESKWG